MWDPDNFSYEDIGDIRYHEPLSLHSTWRIGGPADVFIEPDSLEQIIQIIKIAGVQKIPLVVIGNGSNILFSDAGIRGIVMKLGEKFSTFSIEGTLIHAEAGIYVPTLATAAALAGLSGLEHTIGIPGSLGGLVCMNGGSQKKSIGDIVNYVWAIDRTGNLSRLSRDDCHFSYRHSFLQESGMIICKVELNCRKGDVSAIQKEMNEILTAREQKFPMDLPSCGSVFLSNPDINKNLGAPGKLIEEAGLKGYRIGGAQVSLHHGNFIVNLGKAKATDIIALIHYSREKIYDLHKIWLMCEIKYIDEIGMIRQLHEVK